jgi:hypothetical protein
MSDSEHEPALSEQRSDDAPNDIADLNGDADVAQLSPEPAVDEDAVQANGSGAVGTPDMAQKPVQQPNEGSELESVDVDSVDGIPKGAGSPMDSVISGQNISPSIQVCDEAVDSTANSNTL